ncbi:hypothetical protein [Paenibacillus sp. IHBB 10380]|uniref:hypothetical protein n=1 Tax=Paenibacillus sp. IHBB 10380 TaxID=1566358 RepID=UPI000B13B6CA|nr:hypothetical protein [Paenibacillus sp. IHBB 10380]
MYLTLQLSLSLGQFNVLHELHVFPEGNHGLGLVIEIPEVAIWTSLCMTWLKKQGM